MVAGLRLLGVVGPTASGKTELALRLAREHSIEVVACDSLQVYRGLDVGSAKPTAAERAAVPHHLLDVVDADQAFTAADYAREARAAVVEIAARGRVPVVVGGTGLYLKALLEGIFAGPGRDPGLRARLERVIARGGGDRLHRWLGRVDPQAAARIEPADRVRVVRALEVWRETGRPISAWQPQVEPLRGFEVRLLGLAPPRPELRRRVEARTDTMLDGGLLDEVAGLLRHYPPTLRPLQAIGYREARQVLGGELGVAAARHAIVTRTMQYAKRQMTWFRHQAVVEWTAGPDDARARAAGFLGGEG